MSKIFEHFNDNLIYVYFNFTKTYYILKCPIIVEITKVSMNTLIVGGEGGIGRELSTRLAEDPATHLNFATSSHAGSPEGVNVSCLPLKLESDRYIYNTKGR